MKNAKILTAAVLALFMAIGVFAGLNSKSENYMPKMELKKMSLEEIQASYSNVILEEGMSLEDVQDVNMMVMENPCSGTGFDLCGPAQAQASAAAHQYANACCCVVTYGWECCNPNDGTLNSFLAIAMPRGNCN
jgi:hypothetical protein